MNSVRFVFPDHGCRPNLKLLQQLLTELGLARLALASVSFASIHIVFFCFMLQGDFMPLVDGVFAAKITFYLLIVLSISLFSMRFSALITKAIDLPFKLFDKTMARLFKWNLTDNQGLVDHDNSHVSSMQELFGTVLMFFFPIALLYLGTRNTILTFTVPAIFVYIIILADVLYNQGDIGFIKQTQMASKLLLHRSLILEPKMLNRILVYTAIYISLVASIGGVLRFNYLIYQKPFAVSGNGYNFVGNYIGSTANGVIFLKCDYSSRLIYVTYDTGLIMTTKPTDPDSKHNYIKTCNHRAVQIANSDS